MTLGLTDNKLNSSFTLDSVALQKVHSIETSAPNPSKESTSQQIITLVSSENKLNPLISQNPVTRHRALSGEISTLTLYENVALIGAVAFCVVTVAAPFLLGTATLKITATVLTGICFCSYLTYKVDEYKATRLVLEGKLSVSSKVIDMLTQVSSSEISSIRNEVNASIPDDSLRALLAYKKVFEEKYSSTTRDVFKDLQNAKNIKTDQTRLLQVCHAWNLYEFEALPAKVEAAFAHFILKNPFFEGSLSDLVEFTKKTFVARSADRWIGYGNSFLVSKKRSSDTLSPEQLQRIEDTETLCRLIFESNVWKLNDLALRP